MKTSSFRYLLKEGLQNIWKNRVMTITSVAVLTTCLVLVGAAYLTTLNVNKMVKFVEDQTEMSVFVKQKVSAEKVKDIQGKIEQLPNIRKVTYISKEQGLANTKKSFGNQGYLLDDLKNRNPIPDMFVVKVKDIAKTNATRSDIQQIDGIEIVNASSDMAHTLTSIRNIVGTIGSTVILALGIISLVIIANAIRATIFARRKEINIMKFVGATNSFIRIPFLVEGFMLGLISALIAFLVIWGCYHYLAGAFTTNLTSFLQSAFDNFIPFYEIAPRLVLAFLITGTVLGTCGSALSVRKHVKV